MYFVKRSSTVPTTASRALKTYWGPFGLMDAHQAEGLRAVRTPIVVRPEPDIPVIGRLLFAAWAGLLDMLETPVEGPGAGIAAGLSGIRDTGASLIAFRTALSISPSDAAVSTEAK